MPVLTPSKAPAAALKLAPRLAPVQAPALQASAVPAPAPLQAVQHPKPVRTLELSFDVKTAAAAAAGPVPAQSADPAAGGLTGMPVRNIEKGESAHS